MPVNCIIIEDEPLAAERVQEYIQKLSYLDLLGTFENALDAVEFLQAQRVDLIFLDIRLGAFSGIQFLETVSPDAEVILTTAYPEYALKGYELRVADYLLKPFTFDRFVQAVSGVQKRLTQRVQPDKRFIFVKTEYRLEKIALAEVLFIEGMRDYRKIHLMNKSIMTLQTFSELEKEIPSSLVCRVHKSYMVAIDKIDSIERERIRIGNHYIPVSDTYREEFYRKIKSS